MSSKKDEAAASIRSEIRSILRQLTDLSHPIDRFEEVSGRTEGEPRFYVCYDRMPRLPITGLRIKSQLVRLPDERVCDDVLELAGHVWHFKDRLKRWRDVNCLSHDVETFAGRHPDLLVCADLINAKKHGENKNRSGLEPKLGLVEFDFRESGVLELYYNGQAKYHEFIVAKPIPIPFKVDIDTNQSSLGSAVPYIQAAFEKWMPLVQAMKVMGDDHPETVVLRRQLFTQRTSSP